MFKISKLLQLTNASANFIFCFTAFLHYIIFLFIIKIYTNEYKQKYNFACLYGRTTCLILKEEHKLRVSENIVLREIGVFVGERNWETVDCRRVHSGELHGEWC